MQNIAENIHVKLDDLFHDLYFFQGRDSENVSEREHYNYIWYLKNFSPIFRNNLPIFHDNLNIKLRYDFKNKCNLLCKKKNI